MMKKNAIYIGIIATLLFVIFRQCNSDTQQRKSQESSTQFLNDTIAYYQNEIGQQVAEKKAIQGDADALEILLSKQIDSTGQLKSLVRNFRKVQAAGNITQATRIDTVQISYEVPVPVDFIREFSKRTDYYSITGTSNQNGVTLNDIQIPNVLSFALGDKKTGWFKNEYRFEVVNSNPFVKTIGLDGFTYKEQNKRLGISLYVGYGISSDFKLEPSAGIGLTYNLFRF